MGRASRRLKFKNYGLGRRARLVGPVDRIMRPAGWQGTVRGPGRAPRQARRRVRSREHRPAVPPSARSPGQGNAQGPGGHKDRPNVNEPISAFRKPRLRCGRVNGGGPRFACAPRIRWDNFGNKPWNSVERSASVGYSIMLMELVFFCPLLGTMVLGRRRLPAPTRLNTEKNVRRPLRQVFWESSRGHEIVAEGGRELADSRAGLQPT